MYGVFLAEDGSRCTVTINGEGISTADSGLIFPYDTPVEIEWEEKDKIEPVQSSAMTVRLISRTDREFVNLYTIDAGSIVGTFSNLRNGTKWIGTLDPENYEEPYATEEGYEVELTFTDFGVLQRIKSDFKGIRSLEYILKTILTKASLDASRLVYKISTTMLYDTAPLSLANLFIDTNNFIDEDGEPMTLDEVLTSILQPLGLRIIQKNKYIYVYDLNALYGTESKRIEWDNTDSNLGVDSVYNDVTLTFSPYSRKEIADSNITTDDLPDATSADKTYVYKFNKETDDNVNPDSFKFIVYKTNPSKSVIGNIEISDKLRIFRIKPIYSGSDEAGYAYGARSSQLGGNYSTTGILYALPSGNESFGKISGWKNDGSDLSVINQTAMIKTTAEYVQHNLSDKYMLKVCLSVLFSPLYNPFEDSEKNERGNENNFKNWCNFGYIPCRLTVQTEGGKVLYHYSNLDIYKQNNFNGSKGKWVEGNCNIGEFMLAYYDWENRKSETGFLGWKTNKQCIGYYRDTLPKVMNLRGDGEFVPLPPVDGYLVLEIGEGVIQFDYKRESKDAWSKARWLLYKDVKIDLVNEYGKEVDLEDIELKAWLNKSAKDNYSIDTTSGSFCKGVAPTSRGVIFYKNNGTLMPLKELLRANVIDTPERLLIGTVYSQYSQRHTTLSGTVKLLPDLNVYSDDATEGKFMLLSEVQDARANTSEVKLSLLTEEEYKGVEYYE